MMVADDDDDDKIDKWMRIQRFINKTTSWEFGEAGFINCAS